ncbi:hypothetical protein PT931_02730 [Longispora urticae]
MAEHVAPLIGTGGGTRRIGPCSSNAAQAASNDATRPPLLGVRCAYFPARRKPTQDRTGASRQTLAERITNRGAVEGAFLNPAGHLQVDDNQLVVGPAARLSATVREPAAFLAALRAKLDAAGWSSLMSSSWRAVVAEIRLAALQFPTANESRTAWLGIADDIEAKAQLLSTDE